MTKIDPRIADELRTDLLAAVKYNQLIQASTRDDKCCGGCFGAGTGV